MGVARKDGLFHGKSMKILLKVDDLGGNSILGDLQIGKMISLGFLLGIWPIMRTEWGYNGMIELFWINYVVVNGGSGQLSYWVSIFSQNGEPLGATNEARFISRARRWRLACPNFEPWSSLTNGTLVIKASEIGRFFNGHLGDVLTSPGPRNWETRVYLQEFIRNWKLDENWRLESKF